MCAQRNNSRVFARMLSLTFVNSASDVRVVWGSVTFVNSASDVRVVCSSVTFVNSASDVRVVWSSVTFVNSASDVRVVWSSVTFAWVRCLSSSVMASSRRSPHVVAPFGGDFPGNNGNQGMHGNQDHLRITHPVSFARRNTCLSSCKVSAIGIIY
jgi:hypothetical protein